MDVALAVTDVSVEVWDSVGDVCERLVTAGLELWEVDSVDRALSETDEVDPPLVSA